MKNILLVLAVFAVFNSYSQQSTRKSPHDTVSSANTIVTYGRPFKNNREVFGGLENFAKDVNFAGAVIKAGTYTLFAIPEEKEWTIILNSQLGQWGAYGYEKNKDKNVASVKVPVMKLSNVVEQLTIRFAENGSLVIEWDMTQVTVPLSF